jgi:hypothetical protein
MAGGAAEIFRQAAQIVRDDARRTGNCLRLGSPGRILVAGDIHGHGGNLDKILSCTVARDETPLLILQEILHGPIDSAGVDLSVEVLLRAVRAMLADPQRIVFLLGNHDLAQFTNCEITKAGRGTNRAFCDGVRQCLGEEAPDAYAALMGFLRALPLAARFDNGVLVSHSLPSPDRMDLAGVDILDRPSEESDLRRGGAAYEWTWGRDQTPPQLEALAERLGVSVFILGHRHIQSGRLLLPNRAIAINSDGPGGMILEFDSRQNLTYDDLPDCCKPIASL